MAIVVTSPAAPRRRIVTSRAMAMAPLPVPTSTIRTGGEPTGRAAAASRCITSSAASSTSRSVSGLGMSALESTVKARP